MVGYDRHFEERIDKFKDSKKDLLEEIKSFERRDGKMIYRIYLLKDS